MMKKIAFLFWFIYVYAYALDIDTLIPIYTPTDQPLHYYQTPEGKVIGIDNTLIVKCAQQTLCIDTNAFESIQGVRTMTKRLYVITLKDANQTLSMCRTLQSLPDVVRATPNIRLLNAYR